MRAAVALATLIVCGCGAAPTPPAIETPIPPSGPIANPTFPLAAGASWTYQGSIRWADEKTGEPRDQQVTWISEVVEVIDRGPVVAYVLRGHPADLVWSEGEAQRGDWLILRVDNRTFHLMRATPELVEQVRTAKDPRALAAPADVFLELPLRGGQRICKDPEAPEYCWEVEDIEGGFRLAYRTRPDHTVVDFAPGKGVVAYSYAHHGTLAEVDVALTGYTPGK
jgi:hypothetical protein